MRRSIDNGLLPAAATQQEIEKRLEINDRSLSHRRHSDVVEGSKSNASPVVPSASKQSSLLPTTTASVVGGDRALSTPLPLHTGPSPHPGLAWDISSLISSQTGNTGGTGQDTGLGSLMYSMTTSGSNNHSLSTVPLPTSLSSDKQSYHHSMSSDSSRNSSTTQLNLSG
jgi:hypothetical protein